MAFDLLLVQGYDCASQNPLSVFAAWIYAQCFSNLHGTSALMYMTEESQEWLMFFYAGSDGRATSAVPNRLTLSYYQLWRVNRIIEQGARVKLRVFWGRMKVEDGTLHVLDHGHHSFNLFSQFLFACLTLCLPRCRVAQT